MVIIYGYLLQKMNGKTINDTKERKFLAEGVHKIPDVKLIPKELLY